MVHVIPAVWSSTCGVAPAQFPPPRSVVAVQRCLLQVRRRIQFAGENTPGLAGRIGNIAPLGLVRRLGNVMDAKAGRRKINRVISPRVCCSVCHDDGVESAPPDQKFFEDLIRHCSRKLPGGAREFPEGACLSTGQVYHHQGHRPGGR